MPWLLKTEPSEYSYADLEKEKKAVWTGVANALALQHLRTFKKGDLCLIYHTGNEKQVVGVAECVRPAYPDPNEDDEKLVVVDLKPKAKLKKPVTLAELKADPAFAGWALLKIGRLSVVPTPQELFDRVIELGGK